MRDLGVPPFTAGDTAYTRPAPGGYAAAGDVPDEAGVQAGDDAYAVPSLGGEFQPGPSGAVVTKNSAADGGAAALAAAATTPVTPPAPVAIVATVAVATDKKTATIALTGGPTAPADVDYALSLTMDADPAQTATVSVPSGTSLAATSAMIRQALQGMTGMTANAIAGSAQIELVADVGKEISALTVT